MNVRISLLALALAAASAPAFAGSADIYNLTQSGDVVMTSGYVDVYGTVDVSSKSAAVVNSLQDTESNTSLGDGDHIADFTDNAGAGASGNIGINVSAGVGNTQSNDAALSAVDGNRVFASAMVFSDQFSAYNFAGTLVGDTNYSATLDGNALRSARGNIGVNVAAGVGNAQSNGMAASVNSSGRMAIASTDSNQLTGANQLNSLFGDLDFYSYVGGSALAGAQGNIGVNVTAGIGNLQHNSIAIASSSD